MYKPTLHQLLTIHGITILVYCGINIVDGGPTIIQHHVCNYANVVKFFLRYENYISNTKGVRPEGTAFSHLTNANS